MNTISDDAKKRLCQFPLYSQDGKGDEAVCVAIFALGSIRWFILEGTPEGDDITMFGIEVGPIEDVYGYFSLKGLMEMEADLAQYGIDKKLTVRLQEEFNPTPLKNILDNRLKSLLARFKKEETLSCECYETR